MGFEKSSIGTGTTVSQSEWQVEKNGHLTPPGLSARQCANSMEVRKTRAADYYQNIFLFAKPGSLLSALRGTRQKILVSRLSVD